MTWQEIVFFVGGFAGALMLLPGIIDKDAAWPRKSSIPTAIMLATYSIAFYTLGLKWSAYGAVMTFSAWTVIAIWKAPTQKRTDNWEIKPMSEKTQSDCMDDEMKKKEVDYDATVKAATDFIEALGLDLDNEHLRGTPTRLAKSRAYELFGGLRENPRKHLNRTFEDSESLSDQLIIVDNVQVDSMCAHHWLPFRGRAHVGYIPDESVVGLSKLSRVVDGYARRPQVQERLTNQIADAIYEELQPKAVIVFINAEHECMSCRGVREAHSSTRTTALRGQACDDASIKQEFFDMLNVG